ncbi:DUF4333 domain-containing protein [Antrihabitans stalactiti]|uniref:DUF4333 domain-containing protein n=1 Tax=Antrihabitans stalactiti TaxID=2584121 RepID=UPI0030B84A63
MIKKSIAAAAIACALAVSLTGCGSKIKADGAEKTIADFVSSKTGFKPTDVKCPSDVDAKEGVEFDCHFTGPEGKPYTVNMKITKVDGDNVNFDIDSHLS